MDKWSRISAALSHGEETGDGHQPLYWEKIDNASDDNFLKSVSIPSVASALSSNKYHNETTAFPCDL
jgi:hypothetical protein